MSDHEELDLDYPDPDDRSGIPEPDWNSTFLDEDDDIEIISGGVPPQEAPAALPEGVEELRRQLKEQQDRIERLTQENQQRNMLEPVMSQLQQMQQQQQMPQREPGESEEEFRKRLDDNYLETGITGAMDEYFARRLRPEVQRLLQNNLYTSRRLAMLDPEKGPLYQKYRQEVEQYVQNLPPQQRLYSPTVYEDAITAVSARHGDEIINERLQQALEQERERIKEELRKEMGLASAPKRAARSATPIQGAPGPGSPRTGAVKMSLEQLRIKYPEHSKAALARGVPEHVYFKTLAKKGLLK